MPRDEIDLQPVTHILSMPLAHLESVSFISGGGRMTAR